MNVAPQIVHGKRTGCGEEVEEVRGAVVNGGGFGLGN